MKIIVSVDENGYISCKTIKNDYLYRYVMFSNYSDIINNILTECTKIVITNKDNGTIKFKNGISEVLIESYHRNMNDELNNIIEKAFYIHRKLKLERIRKKKVKRMKTFAGALIVSLGVTGTSIAISNIKNSNESDLTYINEMVNDNIVYTDNSVYDNNVKISINKEKIDNIISDDLKGSFNLEYSDRTGTDKYINAKENYYSLISSITSEYGIDPQIMLAIATQESGVHNTDINGPAMGLMQIERSVWVGEDITAFNHKTNSKETLHITEEKLKDLEFNIRVACMVFQNYFVRSNYNLEVAIQMYNYGPGNILKAFRMYYDRDDITLNEVLNNYTDEWLDYRQYIDAGDKDYLEHILSYIENPDEIQCFDNNGNLLSYEFNNSTKTL